MEDGGKEQGLSIQCSLNDEKKAREFWRWKLVIGQVIYRAPHVFTQVQPLARQRGPGRTGMEIRLDMMGRSSR